jgi:NADH-quinone oxidoreductase subunit L
MNFLGYDVHLMTLIALLLFCGAIGKSAQMPLHVWLPDAMEGPPRQRADPCRDDGDCRRVPGRPLQSHIQSFPTALMVVALTGANNLAFAATIGLVQNDIKRIIAYSTISQLGYMFLACGSRCVYRRYFPPLHPCLLQALLFSARKRHVRAWRANSIFRNGRPEKIYARDLLDMLLASEHIRSPQVCRLLQ